MNEEKQMDGTRLSVNDHKQREREREGERGLRKFRVKVMMGQGHQTCFDKGTKETVRAGDVVRGAEEVGRKKEGEKPRRGVSVDKSCMCQRGGKKCVRGNR